MAEVFSKDLTDHTAPARRALAEKLIAQSDKASDNPADQFVVLGGAIDAAREGGSLLLCFTAADAMAKSFEVDALAVKADAAIKANIKADTSPLATENVQSGLKLLGQLEATDDFDTEARVATALQKSAAAIPAMKLTVQTRITELHKLQQDYLQMSVAAKKLATEPEDPAANAVVGRYQCFTRGNWDAGLTYIAKSSDAKLAGLARQEIARPEAAADLVSLADAWWQYSDSQSGLNKARVMDHAASLYQTAMPGITGLAKATTEKRIAEAHVALRALVPARPVDLLALVDLDKDVVRGKWTRDKNAYVCEVPQGSNADLELPYIPPEEYDFRVSFTRTRGQDSIDLLLTHGRRDFAFCMDPHDGGRCGLDRVAGKAYHETSGPSTAKVTNSFLIGQRHNVLIQIRKGNIKTYIDDKVVLDYPTDYANLDMWDARQLKHPEHLGIGSCSSGIIFHSVEVTEISGDGKVGRE